MSVNTLELAELAFDLLPEPEPELPFNDVDGSKAFSLADRWSAAAKRPVGPGSTELCDERALCGRPPGELGVFNIAERGAAANFSLELRPRLGGCSPGCGSERLDDTWLLHSLRLRPILRSSVTYLQGARAVATSNGR
jgi:hypothetical protein